MKRSGTVYKLAYKWTIFPKPRWLNWRDEVSICSLFWRIILTKILELGFMGALASLFYIMIKGFTWPAFWGILLFLGLVASGLGLILGVFFIVLWIAESEFYEVTTQYIKAKKSKICPMIKIED